MSRFTGVKPSKGRIIVCSVLAILVGLIQPFAAILGFMMPMACISFAMTLTAAFYAYAGWIPAVILMGVGTISSILFLDIVPGLLTLLMWLLPAGFILKGIHGKQPFFSQLAKAVAISMGATALAIVLTGLLMGGDMISVVMTQIRETFESQKEIIWTAVQSTLNGSGVDISQEDFFEIYYQVFNTLQSYYEYYLLSNLLSGAAISAIISVFWGNWLSARRGEASEESFKGLSEFFLPSNMTFGILLVLAVTFILAQFTDISGIGTVWVVVGSLAQLAFTLQALAASDRKARSNGYSRGKRTFIVVLLLIFSMIFSLMSTVLSFIGCASALFGRKGALRPWIDKIKNQTNDNDR